MAYGDLLGYLRKSRGIHDQYHHGEGEAFELQPYDLVLFAKHIATGMVYLGSRGVCKQLWNVEVDITSFLLLYSAVDLVVRTNSRQISFKKTPGAAFVERFQSFTVPRRERICYILQSGQDLRPLVRSH